MYRDLFFEIEPDSFDIRLEFSCTGQNAGRDYQLSYRVKSDDGRVSGLNFTVKVASNVAIKVELIDGPSYVRAGEGYSLVFLITNNGNIPVALNLRVNDNLSYALKSSVSKLELEPARSGRVTVEVKTSRTLLEQNNHIVILIAGIESGDGGSVSGRSSVLLLPTDRLSGQQVQVASSQSIDNHRLLAVLLSGSRSKGWKAFLNDEKTRSRVVEYFHPVTGATGTTDSRRILRYRGEILEAGYGSLPAAGQARHQRHFHKRLRSPVKTRFFKTRDDSFEQPVQVRSFYRLETYSRAAGELCLRQESRLLRSFLRVRGSRIR